MLERHLQKLFDIRANGRGIGHGAIALNNVAFTINQEFLLKEKTMLAYD